jgi:hypothetical protein
MVGMAMRTYTRPGSDDPYALCFQAPTVPSPSRAQGAIRRSQCHHHRRPQLGIIHGHVPLGFGTRGGEKMPQRVTVARLPSPKPFGAYR